MEGLLDEESEVKFLQERENRGTFTLAPLDHP